MADLDSLLEEAKTTGMLHLSYFGLSTIPADVFKLTNLVRLDLGWNEITEIPPEIGKLTKLEQLWLNSTPLTSLTNQIQNLHKLKVLDLRDTCLVNLPCELGRLKHLAEIDLTGTSTLKPKLREANKSGTQGLLDYLQSRDLLKLNKRELQERLRDGVYREVVDTSSGELQISLLVKEVFKEFTEPEDQKNLIRNAERLFPADITAARPVEMRQIYVQLKRENEKKKLAAEVELKLRAIYFDVIRPAAVEGVVKSIYEEISELEDIKFLIRHARELFPPHPDDFDAGALHIALLQLQQRMAEERSNAVDGLDTALRAVYNSVEPNFVRKLALAVASRFKRVEELKKLSADASEFFPAEFEAARPLAIRALFVKRAKAEEQLL